MLNILIVEDNQGDVLRVKEALRDSGLQFQMKHLANGELALAYLNNGLQADGACWI